MLALLLVLVLALGYLALVILGSRWRNPRFGPVPLSKDPSLPDAETEITVTTWNIGFAALGAKADFVLDNGTHLRALSRTQIENAAHQIANDLAADVSDVLLLQETAQSGFLTRNVPVQYLIERALPDRASCYWSDMATVAAPPPVHIDHGMATFAARRISGAQAIELSPQPMIHRGLLKKYYSGLVTCLPIKGRDQSWVIINLHLSAFDATAEAKTAQIAALFAFARTEHAKSNPVIIGGDWNMLMSDTTFPHSAELANADWVYDFPTHLIPAGWQQIADPETPTVRSMQQPYIEGENETMIIDGFIFSPDVQCLNVHTRSTGFAHTDHHPVTGRFVLV
ncbi:endonuclease/exonuclease/phosphatase family protein [Sulfitobacter aestuariivivens]|uniref:Endonuclease/exonuclease/phosphatase family protein n=1 Tax=Sulfitobacter aestuariivivens TaxID=2766981 RepID=A0A927D801_9RHOB|nr:endonuclease/exonuclease/phosphatase family protein [Sulfitobacter aestuariivivens]MBD3664902.1 endonuclease/exonuclease/phosphatase family protein [Sulfitobacter aestuariivivens]